MQNWLVGKLEGNNQLFALINLRHKVIKGGQVEIPVEYSNIRIFE